MIMMTEQKFWDTVFTIFLQKGFSIAAAAQSADDCLKARRDRTDLSVRTKPPLPAAKALPPPPRGETKHTRPTKKLPRVTTTESE